VGRYETNGVAVAPAGREPGARHRVQRGQEGESGGTRRAKGGSRVAGPFVSRASPSPDEPCAGFRKSVAPFQPVEPFAGVTHDAGTGKGASELQRRRRLIASHQRRAPRGGGDSRREA
jgi:hypothetical protein